MKYSEYLQLCELLETNNISIEEYIKNPQLYEGVLGTIGAGLWNLAKKGMKKAVSAGVSAGTKDKLNAKAEEIKQNIVDDIEKAEEDSEHPLYKFMQMKNEEAVSKQIRKYIHRQVERQVKKVEQSISKSKTIDDDDKENLLDYWEDLSIQIELSVATTLSDKEILGDDDMDEIAKALKNLTKRGEGKPSNMPNSSNTNTK